VVVVDTFIAVNPLAPLNAPLHHVDPGRRRYPGPAGGPAC